MSDTSIRCRRRRIAPPARLELRERSVDDGGVILSQLIRGAAEELVGRRASSSTPSSSAPRRRAAQRAYGSAREPAEGRPPPSRATGMIAALRGTEPPPIAPRGPARAG